MNHPIDRIPVLSLEVPLQFPRKEHMALEFLLEQLMALEVLLEQQMALEVPLQQMALERVLL